MKLRAGVIGTVVVAWSLGVAAQTPPVNSKVDLVSVAGCLKQEGTAWMLTNATEPVVVPPGTTSAVEPGISAPGKNRFAIIGMESFNLAANKDHAVRVKGLLIKASPASRINLTSVQSIAPSCTAAK